MVKQYASSPKRSGSCPSADPPHSASPIVVMLRALLYVYRALVSPLLPRACRFHPTCSQFALDALGEHGTVTGLRLTLARLARCHPWNPGGYDPVPSRKV
jgi:putative membrane protein insertion efficiency factor